jgi:hypothetical protein
VEEARVGLSRLLRRLVPADARSNRCVTPFWSHFSSADWCERRRFVPAIFGVRVAPACDEPRSGSNNSERESTSGLSTNYGSGHLIRVFRDIGRIFSLPFLLSHPSPIGQPQTVSIVFRAELPRTAACSVAKREPRPRALGRGLGEPSVRVPRAIDTRAPLRKPTGALKAPHGTSCCGIFATLGEYFRPITLLGDFPVRISQLEHVGGRAAWVSRRFY